MAWHVVYFSWKHPDLRSECSYSPLRTEHDAFAAAQTDSINNPSLIFVVQDAAKTDRHFLFRGYHLEATSWQEAIDESLRIRLQ